MMNLENVKAIEDRDDHYIVVHGDDAPFKIHKKDLEPDEEALLHGMCMGGAIKGYDESSPTGTVTDPAPSILDLNDEDIKSIADSGVAPSVGQLAAMVSNRRAQQHREADDKNVAQQQSAAETDVRRSAGAPPQPAADQTDINAGPVDAGPVGPVGAAATTPPPPDGVIGAGAVGQQLETNQQQEGLGDQVLGIANNLLPADQTNPEGQKAYDAAISAGASPAEASAEAAKAIPPPVPAAVTSTPPAQNPVAPVNTATTPPGTVSTTSTASGTATQAATEPGIGKQYDEQVKREIADRAAVQFAQNDIDKKNAEIEGQKQIELQRISDDMAAKQAANDQASQETFEAVRNGRIDPNNYWHSMSDPGRALSGLGMVINAFTSGWAKQPNAALEMFNRQTDNDIKAQEFNQNKNIGLLNYYLNKGNNIRQAGALAKSMYLDIAAAQLAKAQDELAPALRNANTDLAVDQLRKQALTERSKAITEGATAQYAAVNAKANAEINKNNATVSDINLSQQELLRSLTRKALQDAFNKDQEAKASGAENDTGRPARNYLAEATGKVNHITKSMDPDYQVDVHTPVWERDAQGKRTPYPVYDPAAGAVHYVPDKGVLQDKGQKTDFIKTEKNIQAVQDSVSELRDLIKKTPNGSWAFESPERAKLLSSHIESLLTSAEIPTTRLSEVDLKKAASQAANVGVLDSLTGKNDVRVEELQRYVNQLRSSARTFLEEE